MDNIYLSYGLFLVLLGFFFFVSYLYYKKEKGYFLFFGVILLFVNYGYLTNIFYSFFLGGGANFTGIMYGIVLLIIVFIYILLTISKIKEFFLLFSIFVFLLTFLFTLGLLNDEINKKKIIEFNRFVQSIIDNPDKVTIKDREKLSLPIIKNSKYDWKLNTENIKKAKHIVGLYNFEYCKKTKSDECYLNFIKGKKGLEGYESFAEKYNDFIKKYGKDIKEEIIFKGLEKDLVEEINKNIKKQSVKVLEEIGIKHTSNVKIGNIVGGGKFYENKVIVGGLSYNYFLKKLYNNDKKEANKKLSGEFINNLPEKIRLIKLDIDNKRELIKNRLDNLKKYYFNDLTYIEDFKSTGKKSDGKNTFVLYRSNIDVKFDDFKINLKFNDGNALYIKYYADIEKYLNDSNYRKKYFENLRLLYYYFSEGDIKPYITDVKITNLGLDMKFSYSLNKKYSNNIIIKTLDINEVKEKSLTILTLGEIGSEGGIIKNDWKDISIFIEKGLLKQKYKIALISDKDGKIYFSTNPKVISEKLNKFVIKKPSLDLIKHNYLNIPYWTTTNSFNNQYLKIEDKDGKNYNECIKNKSINNKEKYDCFIKYMN